MARVATALVMPIFRFVVVLSVLRGECKGHYMYMVTSEFYVVRQRVAHKDVMV
jgi:hypothetical protein